MLALAVADEPGSRPGAATAADTRSGLVAELATQPRGVRPIELVRGLIAVSGATNGPQPDPNPPPNSTGSGVPVLDRACRTHQWIERDGIRQEPLVGRVGPAGADRALHALERAS